MVVGRFRADPTLGEARRLRRSIGIEGWSRNIAATGPESGATHFMRIGLASNRVGAGALGRSPAREATYRQIETSPEKMHGTYFPEKTGAEFLQHLVDPQRDAPELMHRRGIIGGMNLIFLKRNRFRNLAGSRPDLHLDAHIGQSGHELLVELGHALRLQRDSR